MSRFTVIVPAYKTEEYLPSCLDSLRVQTFADWDAVVVIDGSPDSCVDIARTYAELDSRFSVIEFPCNRGRHAARKGGVAAAAGEYLCFLDSDDTFESDLLATLDASLRAEDADVIHFGVTIVAEDGMAPETVSSFEGLVNAPKAPLSSLAALELAFCSHEGVRDWRLTQRAYRRDLLKRAFALTTDERLEVGEDSYEYFSVACLLRQETTCNDAHLVYHLGRGITGASQLPVEKLLLLARHYRGTIEAVQELAARFAGSTVRRAADMFIIRLCEDVGGVWANRCPSETRLEIVWDMARIVGPALFAAQMARIARDEAYASFVADVPPQERDTASAKELLASAQELLRSCGPCGQTAFLEEYEKYRNEALLHIHEVETGVVPAWRKPKGTAE